MAFQLLDLDKIIIDRIYWRGEPTWEQALNLCSSTGIINYRDTVKYRIFALKMEGYIQERDGRLYVTEETHKANGPYPTP